MNAPLQDRAASGDSAAGAAGADSTAAQWLLTPEAIRAQCALVMAAARAGELDHFAFDEDRLDQTADYVLDVTRAAYPDLDVPFHSRWRHFAAGGIDRWAALAPKPGDDRVERARSGFDLAITSVLLDAGAGALWRYRETETGASFARSEGLGVASLRLFAAGGFSDHPPHPLRADAAALSRFDSAALARAFQVTDDNPLAGLDGRAALIRRLGEAVAARTDLFGEERRLGNLFDTLKARANDGALPARAILIALLDGLGPIWPGRTTLGGHDLGDTWAHRAAVTNDRASGLVPFHKLSQWLAYSLVEPLMEAGITVTDLDALTGLAEYRNGGLFVDMGVLLPKHERVTANAHAPGDEIVVEWRALTVMLLDEIAVRLRVKLGLDETSLPLPRVLEGGTWAAGRKIAAERRPGGGPPIAIESDGSVF